MPVVVNKDWADYVYIIAGILVAVATLVIAVTALRQVATTKATAEAAKSQADAVITGERPWLLTEAPNEPLLETAESGAQPSSCVLTIKNFGKTPAKVIAEKSELRIGTLPTLPPTAEPYSVNGSDVPSYFVPQGETTRELAFLTPGWYITEQEQEAVLKTHTKYLFLCGFIKYRDTLERKDMPGYETRYCYLYETRTNAPKPYWRVVGTEQWNRAT